MSCKNSINNYNHQKASYIGFNHQPVFFEDPLFPAFLQCYPALYNHLELSHQVFSGFLPASLICPSSSKSSTSMTIDLPKEKNSWDCYIKSPPAARKDSNRMLYLLQPWYNPPRFIKLWAIFRLGRREILILTQNLWQFLLVLLYQTCMPANLFKENEDI